jgi:hypothetical protein
MAVGLAATLVVLGIWIGQRVAPGGEAGFYDTRGINRLFWTIVLAGLGFVLGLPLGYRLGKKLATRSNIAIPLAAVLWLIPMGAYAQYLARAARIEEQIAEQRVKREEEFRQQDARAKAARDLYISSGQYDIDKQGELDRLNVFPKEMPSLIYPGSVLQDRPNSRTLRYTTADDKSNVENHLIKAGCILGYAKGSPRGQRLMYYKWLGLTGTIYIEDAHDGSSGTWITYTMPA